MSRGIDSEINDYEEQISGLSYKKKEKKNSKKVQFSEHNDKD